MTCHYCRAVNADYDHRCHRCGRRLDHERPAAQPYIQGAAAPALEVLPPPVESAPAVAEAQPEPARVAWQRSLFSSREMPQVVRFETIAPHPPAQVEHEAGAGSTRKPSRPRLRKPIPGQQGFEFTSSSALRATEPVIFCDAPVAVPAHRVMAAALDAIVILAGVALFGATYYFGGGPIQFTRPALGVMAGVGLLLALLYKALWYVADGDSPGMGWARLRVIDFDGRRPSPKQRLHRFASGWLSLLSAGLGLLWALVDEEALTWHDHISKTFPTPYE